MIKKFWHISSSDTGKSTILKLIWCLIFLVIPVFSSAQIKTTVSEIISNPDAYNGKIVQVDGKAFQIKFKISKRGNPYTVFKLTDGKTYVSVFSFGRLSIIEGDNVRVKGTYQKVKYVGRYVFYNEIDATKGMIERK